MKHRLFTVSICTLLILLPLASALAADAAREFVPVQKGFSAQGEKVLPYAPDRLMVKFKANTIPESKKNIGLYQGASFAGARTGIASVDAIGMDIGVVKISRPFIQLKNENEARLHGTDRWFMVELRSGSDVMDAVSKYAADPNVEYAKPDWRAFPAAVPTDPLYDDHWGHNNTAQMISYNWSTHTHTGPTVGTVGFDANAQAAWDGSQGYGSSSVVIAILDSGVDIDHPDLQANLVSGYDFGDNDSNPDDNSGQPGHGTCCAGVAVSIANNGIGSCGVAPGCRVMPCKIANSAGSMYFSAIDNALYWAADNGADIISMSVGAAGAGPGDIPSTDAALAYAYNAGCVVLAATGNDNNVLHYPANHVNVIGVGAASPCGDRKRSSSSSFECNPGVSTDPNGYTCDGERWWGSNYGPSTQDAANATDIIAPTIVPTTDIGGSGGYDPGDYDMWFNGTSCATPYAAGVCALIKSANPTWTNAQIRDQLCDTAIDIINVESGSGWDRYSGYGMVDAEAAVGGGGPVPPVAEFSGSPTSGQEPLTVDFTDLSSGSPTSWSWVFGDGGTSTEQNPTYTYNTAGTYTVRLTATNSVGSDEEIKTDYVTVTIPPPPVAQFSASPTSGEVPLDVTFTDESSNNPTSWSWDFGDGGTSTDQHPSYTYNTVGTYTVTLTATNAYGSDDEIKTDYITVTEQGVAQKSYALSETGTAGTVSGSFTDTHASDNVREAITEVLSTSHPRKTYSYLEHIWTFNVPSGSAATTFYLEASRPANSDGDDFVFTYSTDGATWNSLTTVASATEQVYSASIPTSVSGTVYVQVVDNVRSWGTNSLDAIYVDEMYFETEVSAGPPVADFTGSPTTGYAPLTVNFTDLSSGAPDSWSWTFGDGGTSTAQNPSYTYNTVGTYTVTLTATNSYGSDVEQKVDYITVNELTGTVIHVSDIAVTYKSAGPNQFGQAYVTVLDQDNTPVSGATVYGFFNYPDNTVYSALTGSDGVAFIEGGKDKNISDFCFEVTDVVLGGATYDSGANDVTKSCESGDVFSADRPAMLAYMESPDQVMLLQNYPNPFNPTTTIAFSLPEAMHVKLDVFTIAGERVASLVNETRSEGPHVVSFDASKLSSGIYLYRFVAGDFREIRKMLLLK